jgi:A/G-specific adenine glycosylase
VRPGETPEGACKREIAEEVNLDVEVVEHVARVHHAYTHFKVSVDVFECVYKAGEVALRGPVAHRWILAEETARYPFPAVNHRIFRRLSRRGRGEPDETA